MEFHEKLQHLRKQKGLTQEELANALFVSRAAVSKWESGRSYPGIDSLKAISKLFSVTIDELLSGEQILNLAAEEQAQTRHHFWDLVYGLLDLSVALCLFWPLVAQNAGGSMQEVSLTALTKIAPYVQIAYYIVVCGTALYGILTLTLQTCRKQWWMQNKQSFSLLWNILGILCFVIGRQPYAATLLFLFFIIKILIKKT